MMPPRLILILICLTAVIRGTELVEVVWELKIPSLATAKIVLEKLDRLIENGDARTVTLGKKVQRSVKRIFTKEHKVLAGKKDADEEEAWNKDGVNAWSEEGEVHHQRAEDH